MTDKENNAVIRSPCRAVTRRPFQERSLNVFSPSPAEGGLLVKELKSLVYAPLLSPQHDDEAQMECGPPPHVEAQIECALRLVDSTRPCFAELRRLSVELQQAGSPGTSSPAFVPQVSSPAVPCPKQQQQRRDASDDAVVSALRAYIFALKAEIDSQQIEQEPSSAAPPSTCRPTTSPSHPHAPQLWLTDHGSDTIAGASPEDVLFDGVGSGLWTDVEGEEEEVEGEGEGEGTWTETPGEEDRPWSVSGEALLQGSVDVEVTGRCLRKAHVEFFVLVRMFEAGRRGGWQQAGAISLLCRRFQDFVSLAAALQRAAQRDCRCSQDPPALPPRSLVPKWLTDWRDVAFLDKRQAALGAWLQAVMRWQEAAGQTSRDVLAAFLSPTI